MIDRPHSPPPWGDTFYTHGVSDEPLWVIQANECEAPDGLATSRFRALWNEIQRLRAALPVRAEAAQADTIAVPRKMVESAAAWFMIIADAGLQPTYEDGSRTPNGLAMDGLYEQFHGLLHSRVTSPRNPIAEAEARGAEVVKTMLDNIKPD